jgi:TolA-binding protein
MSGLELGLAVIAGLASIAGAAFVVVALTTAGKGSFLKERNEELANALDQMRAQRDDDRHECRDEIGQLRDQCNQLRGEVGVLRGQQAKVIAEAVIRALEASGWVQGGIK